MKVSDVMTRAVRSCSSNDDLQRCAQIMWDNDCGVVPVVDGDERVVGIVTDRDICMAAYTQGRPLWQIPVSSAMAKQVHGVHENDPLAVVEALMRRVHVRRLPVLDGEGRLKGILSVNDLARHAHPLVGHKSNGLSSDGIVQTLAAICESQRAVREATELAPTQGVDAADLKDGGCLPGTSAASRCCSLGAALSAASAPTAEPRSLRCSWSRIRFVASGIMPVSVCEAARRHAHRRSSRYPAGGPN